MEALQTLPSFQEVGGEDEVMVNKEQKRKENAMKKQSDLFLEQT